jgi:hypothetical protein
VIRKVYLDFQDTHGYRDVSNLVKYESLNITMRPFSDDFHYAQNDASFTLLFDTTIFTLFKTATSNILCKIVDMYDEGYLTAENGAFLLTEAGFYLMRETDGSEPLFYGIIPATSSYTYNGILDNTFFTCNATDSTLLLDKKVGDICYRNYTLMDPVNTSTSVVHQLAYKAGFTALQVDSAITISTVITAVSPPSEDESVLTLLNNLLFDYGYSLNFNEMDQISPIQWNVTTSGTTHQFDDTNILREIKRDEKEIQYEGVEVTYNELADRSNILLYREDLPYNSTGGFAGYALTSGYLYPAEANVIDETTGYNQVVDYVYTDESIKYFTNKAVTKGIQEQWNYKAFSSDFSSIVATSGHWPEWHAGPNVVVVTSGYDVVIDGVNVPTYYFGNKKARIILRNDGAATFLYYLNIKGDVLYRTSDRKLLVQNVTNTTKVDKYVANFLYNATDVGALAAGLAKNYQVGNTTYTFPSEDKVNEGAIVKIYLDDGTNVDGVVMQRDYNEAEPTIYNYTVKSRSSDRGSLTQKRIARYSNSTKQMFLYKGDTLVVAASGYQGYDAHYYCTGANDDVQIQAAIDYLSTTFGGGTVQLTAGGYHLPDSYIYMRDNCLLQGVGASTIIYGGAQVILFTDKNNAGIRDFTIQGGESPSGFTVIICADDTIGTANYVEKIKIKGYIPGSNMYNIGISSTGAYKNTQVNNCIIDDLIATSGNTSVWGMIGIMGATGNKLGTFTKFGSGVAYGMSGCKKCQQNSVVAASTAKYGTGATQSYADSGTANACADNYQGGFNS